MKVQIFSMMAALVGGEHGAQWEGEMSLPGDFDDPDEANEQIFRTFNRIDEADAAFLERIGYRLPSLSVGDFVTWGGKTYGVNAVGFETVTGKQNGAAQYVRKHHFGSTD